MRAKQFILEEKIFRAAQCFQSQTEHEHSTVNSVSAPGERAALRIKRDHDPDADPEERRHDDDLAKQEEAVKSFRPLREHDYLTALAMRVRDGRAASTRARIADHMRFCSSSSRRIVVKSDSHTIAPFA
jgi:hypothetical protein